MTLRTLDRIATMPLGLHALAAAGAVGWFSWIKGKLDASYAASNHPVDYATGQTTFDAARIKGFYGEMEAAGTLDVYRTTQLIDFGFILAMAGIALFVVTLIARLGRDGSWARRLGLIAAVSVLAGALCDAIENGWSFVMLADPAGFADWMALPYSGFAVAKFGLITFGMALVLASLLLAGVGRALGHPRIG